MTEIFEQLPPDSTLDVLLSRKNALERLLKYKKDASKKYPDGKLRISRNKGTDQFYQMTVPGDKKGNYISKSDMDLVRALAQKDYNSKLVPLVERELAQITALIENLKKTPLTSVYENLNSQRKPFVEPATLTDEEYTRRWLNREYRHKDFDENTPEYYAACGIRVRSKSEMIIADTLIRLNVPFLYEVPHKLKSFNVNPDFLCLNVRTRQEVIWEHFGMMDVKEYADRTAGKLLHYQNSGYFPGKNLIITMETGEHPLNSRSVEQLAEEFLV